MIGRTKNGNWTPSTSAQILDKMYTISINSNSIKYQYLPINQTPPILSNDWQSFELATTITSDKNITQNGETIANFSVFPFDTSTHATFNCSITYLFSRII